VPSASATADLWRRLHPATDPAEALAALLGLPVPEARTRLDTLLATSPEAEALLGGMDRTIRSLAVSTIARPDQCRGELRGPVLWSETAAARAASGGADDVFVCVLPERAYDTPENRVLVQALLTIARAGRATGEGRADAADDDAARARANRVRASRWLDHKALASVPARPPDGRSFRRARSGRSARTYAPALALLSLASSPLGPDALEAWADERLLDQHDLVAAVLERVERRGVPCGVASALDGAYSCGPVVYRARFGDQDRGVLVGDVLLDVLFDESEAVTADAAARLARRARGRLSRLVTDPEDVEAALDLAGF
jgi:hypothetical protein